MTFLIRAYLWEFLAITSFDHERKRDENHDLSENYDPKILIQILLWKRLRMDFYKLIVLSNNEIGVKILEFLHKKFIESGGVTDESDESIAAYVGNNIPLNEIRSEIRYLAGKNYLKINEIVNDHLLFVGITSQGIDKIKNTIITPNIQTKIKTDGTFSFAKTIIPSHYYDKLMKILPECTHITNFESVLKFAREMASRVEYSVIGTTDVPIEENIEKILLKRIEENELVLRENRTSSFISPSAETRIKYKKYGFEWLIDTSREAYLATFVVDNEEAGFLFPQKDVGDRRFNWDDGYHTTKKEHIDLIREITNDIFHRIRENSSSSKPFDPKKMDKEIRKVKEDAAPRMHTNAPGWYYAPGKGPHITKPPLAPKPTFIQKNKRSIGVGSFLAVIALVIGVISIPGVYDALFPPEPEIYVTDLTAQGGKINGNKLYYSYAPTSLTPNGIKSETFTLKILNTGRANANNFWIDVSSEPPGLWFDFHSSTTIQAGTKTPCPQQSSYCTIALIPKDSSNLTVEYYVSFDHKLYQEIKSQSPKLLFTYGFEEGKEQTIEVQLKFD